MNGPYAVVLRYRARQPLSAPVPEAVHAAFLGMVRRADPALAATLHSPQHRFRPYTLALLGPRGGLELRLRLSVLAPDLFREFWKRWERRGGFALRLGRTWLSPAAVQKSGPWCGEIPWPRFWELPPVRRVALAFATPTTFRQGDVDLPLPLPKLLFAGLLAKWNAASSRPLSLDPELFSRFLALTEGRVRIQSVWDGRATIRGFVGVVEFRLKRDAPKEVGQALALLSAFAFFAGAGRHTTHGFGLVRFLHAS
mgnify:CR=1 FL=1